MLKAVLGLFVFSAVKDKQLSYVIAKLHLITLADKAGCVFKRKVH